MLPRKLHKEHFLANASQEASQGAFLRKCVTGSFMINMWWEVQAASFKLEASSSKLQNFLDLVLLDGCSFNTGTHSILLPFLVAKSNTWDKEYILCLKP